MGAARWPYVEDLHGGAEAAEALHGAAAWLVVVQRVHGGVAACRCYAVAEAAEAQHDGRGAATVEVQWRVGACPGITRSRRR